MASEPKFSVRNQDDIQEIAYLERLNEELTRSLARCRALVKDCRAKLAANSNEPESTEPFLLNRSDEANDCID